MLRVLLIRHGETAWNRDGRWQGHADVPLSEAGIEQALRLAEFLKREEPPVSRVYSSDLRRASDTAAEICRAVGAELIIDPAWREISVGSWTGLSRDEIRTQFAAEWDRIAAGEDLPRGGGETFGDFSARIVAALDALRLRHAGERIAVVTHGGAIRAALLHALGLPWMRLREVAAVGNTTLSELSAGAAGWEILARGHAPHLTEVAGE
jgi:broad specificity phosphatase PhoE